MIRETTRGRCRCLAVWLAASAATALVQAWLLPQLASSGPPAGASFDVLLVAGCEVAAAGCAGWLWLLVTLVVRDALRGRPHSPRSGVPPVVRRLVLAACGLSLAGGLLAPAQAADGDPAALLAGLSVPDRTTTAQWVGAVADRARPSAREAARPKGAAEAVAVVVRPGDSLWGIAQRSLPPGTGNEAVDERWREIYRANRQLIGVDPDLVRPGQRLQLPPDHTTR